MADFIAVAIVLLFIGSVVYTIYSNQKSKTPRSGGASGGSGSGRNTEVK
jgi:hypothetical protein